MFQNDNTRPHAVRVSQERHNVYTLPWPSTDLNARKQPWDALDQRVRRVNPPYRIHPQPLTALRYEWQNIPQRVVQRLNASIVKFSPGLVMAIRPKKYIVDLWSDQSSRIDAAMWVFLFCFFKTLLYLMEYFNAVLKRPSMKLAGTSMPFCK